MPSPFPCSPVVREWLWKKIQIEKKKNQSISAGSMGASYMKGAHHAISICIITQVCFNNRPGICRYFLFSRHFLVPSLTKTYFCISDTSSSTAEFCCRIRTAMHLQKTLKQWKRQLHLKSQGKCGFTSYTTHVEYA